MRAKDVLIFSLQATITSRGRTCLMLLAMAIGVLSVIILISLGESARRYVVDQFTSLGTNLLIVLPGRSETIGGPPPLLGETPQDLTLEDALALTRATAIRRLAPIIAGSAPVSARELEREMIILGSSADLLEIRHLKMSHGRFLPAGDPRRGENVCVIGRAGKEELFANQRALGEWVRIGDRRFRVIGVLARLGVSLGEDMSEVVIIPVAAAQSVFNTESLFRILVEASSEEDIPRAKTAILSIIKARHNGEDDITVITQDAILATFNRIFRALTLAVGGIAAISLVVAGIMIMNIMLVAVSSRRAEIGLLKALGASRRHILCLFLAESVVLATAGAALGCLLALIVMRVLAGFLPDYSLALAPGAPLLAVVLSLGTGIVFGVLPARRAAMLEPVLALSRR